MRQMVGVTSAFALSVVLAASITLRVIPAPPGCPSSRAWAAPTGETAQIAGVVCDQQGPVAKATVRIQATKYHTTTDAQGRFALTVPSDLPSALKLTTWASGYYCGGPVVAELGQRDVGLQLHAHFTKDNPEYAWLPSSEQPGEGENQGCAECHRSQGTDLPYMLPVDEWMLDAHSQSAVNRRFLTMYTGRDVRGNASPPTRYVSKPEYGRVPLRPDPQKPYFGPGYKLDFPKTAGNCAACHTPAAAANHPYDTDPTTVRGVGAEGVACDLCHKVWDVQLDRETGLPHGNMPGVLSFGFRRPPKERQFFAGPLDVAPGEDTYSALQNQSQFCASCHFGVFWDTVVYNSFGEWLASPYSDPTTGKTCQDCHMPHRGADRFALAEKGGLKRHPETIFSHLMPGAMDQELLQNSVTMKTDVLVRDGKLTVKVAITNDRTGHHVPTDSPLRHLILLVSARDDDDEDLLQLSGPKVPTWCGEGDPEKGNYAHLPGKAFAKVLEEQWTEVSPTGAYWNPTRVLSDNRIAAFCTDKSTYAFTVPPQAKVHVTVKLIFRRAFRQLMEQKGWTTPDILMEEESHLINVDGLFAP